MAEIVGVVAASLELGKFVLELKQIASSIKHAPEELREMLEDLDRTNNILRTLTEQDELLATCALPAVIQECRDSCKKYVDIARPVCLELLKAIKRSKLRGSLKSVLKENLLEKAEKRIERAKFNLILAHGAASYALHALNMQQHATTQTLVISSSAAILALPFRNPQAYYDHTHGALSTPGQPPSPDAEDNSNHLVVTSTQQRPNPCRQRLQTTSILIWQSSWLGKRVEFLRITASGVPFFGIKTYNTVPNYSPIFGAVRDGDVAAIQRLFQDKHASIYDRNEHGETLLMKACRFGQLSSMRFLLEQGADPNEQGFFRNSCLRALITWGWFRRDTIHLLARDHDLEDFTDSDLAVETLCTIAIAGPPDSLSEVMPMLGPTWSNRDFATRLIVADGYCRPNSLARDFWLVLSQQDLDDACLTRPGSTVGGVSPLFSSLVLSLAYTMGRTCIDLEGWRSVLQRMVSLAGLKIPFGPGPPSPMLTYLGFGNLYDDFDLSMAGLGHGRLTCKLRNWAHEVQLAGQDLQAYGRWEQELLSDMYREFLWYRYESVAVRLINFKFGPSPQDWQIWVSTSMDESTGEFWEAVEDEEPVFDIPGSWPTLEPEQEEYTVLYERHSNSRRRRRRFLRYLGLGPELEDQVFEWSGTKGFVRIHVREGKEKKALRRQYYLGNNITPPCREFVS
ncbi:hypothetical protein LTR96_003392 [Exophiala xenobiotica]|nr:hypothetical protein LTR96_003392 [Exophiala xenobiotica]KAK5342804.1 hypothetical protein LTR98_000430 [Exophiala xenobiotica]KAK5549900.1 hypothetical protein LTR23_000191 [Chaetothyriales sp. CCFEE 6169]